MLDYSSNEFFIIYSLHFVCHYLFGGRFNFYLFIYKYKDSIRKINNSFKILKNKQNIIISHS